MNRTAAPASARLAAGVLVSALLTTAPLVASAPAAERLPRELRVCADPNNLPFSNERREGFENRIVDVLARDLGLPVRYTWWAQRRGYLRNALNAGECDLVPGVASAMEMLRTTRPYYRSSYVFVTRAGSGLDLASLDDPRLRELRIGVQLVGDDGANTPPAHALARRGIVDNVRGYPLYGDYTRPNPPARLLDALAARELDVAIAWGPLAGWYAKQSVVALTLSPVHPWLDGPQLPMVFDVSMGVRKEDAALRRALDDALQRNRPAVEAILVEYGVPRL